MPDCDSGTTYRFGLVSEDLVTFDGNTSTLSNKPFIILLGDLWQLGYGVVSTTGEIYIAGVPYYPYTEPFMGRKGRKRVGFCVDMETRKCHYFLDRVYIGVIWVSNYSSSFLVYLFSMNYQTKSILLYQTDVDKEVAL